MIASLRITAEIIIRFTEIIQEKIARYKGIYTLRVPILMYHHIGSTEDNKKKLYVDVKLFEKEMRYLSDNGYTTITLDDLTNALISRKILPSRSIILTFDDGYLDFYTKAFPVLKKYKLKATVFVITSCIDKPGYLSTPMIKELLDSSLITVGSHTVSHPNLKNLPLTQVEYELRESKAFLEKQFGIKVTSFAFPFGSYNNTVTSVVQKAGYRNAVSVKYGWLHFENNVYELKRIRIGNKLTLKDFKRKIMIYG